MQTASPKVKNGKNLTATSTRLRVWVGWVLLNATCGLVALGLGSELPPFLAGVIPSGDEANITGYSLGWAVILAGLLTGLAFGGFEWLYLRRRFAGPAAGWRWIGLSVLAVGVSFTLDWAISGGRSGDNFAHHGLPHAVDLAGIWGGLLIGAVLGIAQWLVLRFTIKTGANQAWEWWWVAANLLGFGVGWWVAATLSAPFENVFGPWNHFWGGMVFGAVFGAFTGIAVAQLTPRRRVAGTRQAGK